MQAAVDRYEVKASATIDAAPERVYPILADYNEHRKILPPAFKSLVIEKGGVGAGTVFRCEMKALGATRTFRASVTEPEPGRRLVETDLDGAVETSFIFEPADGGTRLTISTVLRQKPGLFGRIERFMFTRFLRPLYEDELRRIAEYARTVRV